MTKGNPGRTTRIREAHQAENSGTVVAGHTTQEFVGMIDAAFAPGRSCSDIMNAPADLNAPWREQRSAFEAQPMPLAAALAASTGCEVMTLSLEPVDSGLAEQEAAFSIWLDGIAGHRRIVVIAHSMGGLVARLYLRRHPGRKQIEQLICIGTPNAGSRVASALHSAIGRDLRIDSTALATLASAAGTVAMLDIVAEHDNLVIPASSCRRTGIETISIRGCGHLSLIYSTAVRKLLAAACRSRSLSG